MLQVLFRRKKRKRKPSKIYLDNREKARTIITSRVEHFAKEYDFSYGRITIKDQKRCWGSCSTKKNLNFNYKLIFLPAELLDYVVVHELCHLRHFHHRVTFWKEVEKIIPDYKKRVFALRSIECKYGSSATKLIQLTRQIKDNQFSQIE